jgi:hypothetical protein
MEKINSELEIIIRKVQNDLQNLEFKKMQYFENSHQMMQLSRGIPLQKKILEREAEWQEKKDKIIFGM